MTKTETEHERLQRLMKDRVERPLPKRFYKTAEVSGQNQILLDGRGLKTPLKVELQLPNRRLAEAVAAEWAAQVDVINPALMPLTRLANTAIDRAVSERAKVIDEIVNYAGNDLVCYWADRPPELVQRQRDHWLPVITWTEQHFGVPPQPITGLTHVAQPGVLLEAVRAKLDSFDNWRLTACYLLTTLSGSAFLALMLDAGSLSAEAIWAAANVEEDYQVSQWGEDWEARLRRDARRREFDGLVQFLSLLD